MSKSPVPETQNSNPSHPSAVDITGEVNSFDVGYLQTLDNNTASSILEFFVRQKVIPEYVVNAVFLSLPLANPMSPSLKKAILFRRLASELKLRSVSEKTLNALELIEELDRKNGNFLPSEAMKAAYCAVASSCTAAALRKSVDDFLDSFHRIWVLRICDIDKSAAAGLISEDLREVRDIFWEVVKDPELRPLVVNIDLEETLDRVREYLEEVWDMEPLFPEVAVDDIEKIEAGLRVPGERRNPREGLPCLKNQRFGCAEHTELERLPMETGIEAQNEIAAPIMVSNSKSDGQLDQDNGLKISFEKEQDLNPSNLCVQRFVLDPENKATGLLADNSEQAYNEEFKGNNGQNSGDKLISDSEIGSEGKQTDDDDEHALKASRLDLPGMLQSKTIEMQAVNPKEACHDELKVNDCQKRRDELASTSKKGCIKDTSTEGNETSAMLNKYLKPSCPMGKEENQNGQDVRAPIAFFEKASVITLDVENNSTQHNSDSAALPRVNIMERNPTAHTLEWTDSPHQEVRIHLHSPKREAASPLKLTDAKRYPKRRKIKKWTLLEEKTLLKAVTEHGKGSWKFILSKYGNIFEERTEVDLKDKWRNMTKYNWPS